MTRSTNNHARNENESDSILSGIGERSS